jgi:hypothetical protein
MANSRNYSFGGLPGFGPCRAMDRLHAVGADQHVGRDAAAIFEACLDSVGFIGKADKAMAGMEPRGRKSRTDDREQVGGGEGATRREVDRTHTLCGPPSITRRGGWVACERGGQRAGVAGAGADEINRRPPYPWL